MTVQSRGLIRKEEEMSQQRKTLASRPPTSVASPTLPTGLHKTRPPWWRHSPLAVPIGACLVFLVLIAGGLAVRKVIILLTSSAQSNPIGGDSAAGSPSQARGTAAADTGVATAWPAAERELKVLPPLAAKEPGRRLPRLLVVGETADTFPSIEKALEIAISGDVIEVRTNRPMVVGPVRYEAKDKEKSDDLTIRAGAGFQPVLRCGRNSSKSPMFAFVNTRALLKGLHVVGGSPEANYDLIVIVRGGLKAQDCSFTAVAGPRTLVSLHRDDDGASDKASTVFERCVMRGNQFDIIRYFTVEAVSEVSDCLIVTRTAPLVVHPVPPQIVGGRVVRLKNNTLVGAWLFYNDMGPQLMNSDAPVSLVAESNVVVSFGEVIYFDPRWPTWKSVVGTTFRWSGRDNLFSPLWRWSNLNDTGLKPNLVEWNALWGGNAETGSEVDSAVFARPFAWPMPGGPWVPALGPDVWTATPRDFALQPVGAAGRFAARGVRVGCDVTRLPVPPPVTLEPYDLPAEPPAK
jgi:hypothetical protein